MLTIKQQTRNNLKYCSLFAAKKKGGGKEKERGKCGIARPDPVPPKCWIVRTDPVFFDPVFLPLMRLLLQAHNLNQLIQFSVSE